MKKANTKIIVYTTTASIMILNLILISSNKILERKLNINNESLKSLEIQLKQKNSILSNNLKIEFLNGIKTITIDSIYFKYLEDIIQMRSASRPRLILRFSELNCSTCVDSIIAISKNFDKKFPRKLSILSEYKSDRFLYFFKHMNQFNCDVYNLKKGLDLEIEKINSPYFFLLDSNDKITHLHMPDRHNLSLTREYLDWIAEKYFEE